MELNKKELGRLFEETIKNLENLKESVMFNLYEDEDFYTMETTFDDEDFVVCRENPAKLCETNVDYKTVLKLIKKEIAQFVKNNEESFKYAKEISYGFVDGDLYYIKKSKKQKTKQDIKFTSEDFANFDAFRLVMWLEVYLTDEALKKYTLPNLFSLNELTEEDLKNWRQILADNFDYEKYFKHK